MNTRLFRLLLFAFVIAHSAARAQQPTSFDLAVSSFRQNLFHDALQYFRKAQKDNPTHGEAHHGAAMSLYLTKRHKESLQHFASAEACANPQAQFFTNHAICLEYLSRTEEAIVLLQRAIEIDAKFTNAWFNLGQFRLRQGKLDEALSSLKTTLKLDSKHKAAHYEMGNLFFARKDYKSAEIWAQRAVKLDATNPAPLYLLARTLLRLGRREEGKNLAGKALKLRLESDKKSRIRLKVNASLTLAFDELRRKKISAAMEYFKIVLKYDPTNPQARSALTGLAAAYEKAGKTKTAAVIHALLKSL